MRLNQGNLNQNKLRKTRQPLILTTRHQINAFADLRIRLKKILLFFCDLHQRES